MSYLLYSTLIFIASIILVRVISVLAIRFSLLDIPNQRSMHQTVTPRGGGLVIVLCVVFMMIISNTSRFDRMAIILPLLITASIAFMDDFRSVPTGIRAVTYTISAALFLYLLPNEYSVWFLMVLLVAFVWLMNLYNFMDGIDGLAAIQAVLTSLFACVLFYHIENQPLLLLAIAVLSSSAGFLVWNWSPAQIFMGDVGSCCLGLIFAMLAVLSNAYYSVPFAVWLILLAVFICDTTYTLLWRYYQGEKWYQAHKTHAYQCLVERGYSHRAVCVYVLLTNILLLWPAAFAAYLYPQAAWLINIIIYAIFLYTWWRIKLRNAS